MTVEIAALRCCSLSSNDGQSRTRAARRQKRRLRRERNGNELPHCKVLLGGETLDPFDFFALEVEIECLQIFAHVLWIGGAGQG